MVFGSGSGAVAGFCLWNGPPLSFVLYIGPGLIRGFHRLLLIKLLALLYHLVLFVYRPDLRKTVQQNGFEPQTRHVSAAWPFGRPFSGASATSQPWRSG